MKKLALILSIAVLSIIGMPTQANHVYDPAQEPVVMVYICTGKYATVYHSTPKCSGLNRCQVTYKKFH